MFPLLNLTSNNWLLLFIDRMIVEDDWLSMLRIYFTYRFLWPLSWKIGIKTLGVLLKIFWYFYDVLKFLTCQTNLIWAQNHFSIERSKSVFTQVPFSLNLGHSKCFYKNKLFNDILNIYISLILYFLKLIIDIQKKMFS